GAVAAGVVRLAAPLVPESRLALRNLALALPETSEAERRAILRGAWSNLARTVAEMPSLRRMIYADPHDPDRGLSDRIEIVGGEWFERARDDGVTAIGFTAHYGNWEIMPFVARTFRLPMAALYRPLRNARIDADLARWREERCEMVTSGPRAALRVAGAMKRGMHMAILADQRMPGGVMVPFFGRPAPTNPLIGGLARQFDCPVHGIRSIRLPGGRFRIEVSPPLDLPRDADGRIDADAATAAVTRMIEGWVREHPDQWLWLHNRWGDAG
ncbi:MAG: lipid A biosynthesis lauroyl acyltransferase, partial [Bauldia sp.]|nr:lipid A biosynthesis lauroyl acyltransferase [Bauldia sp.]